MDELDMTAAVLAAARMDPEVGADVRWLRDTLWRVQVRYGRALATLAVVPRLVAEANRWQVPEATWNEAEEAAAAVRRAIDELDRVADYLDAVLDPGPATCGTCGEQVGTSQDGVGWKHWRAINDQASGLARFEFFDTDHDAVPVFGRPDRPAWDGDEPALASGGVVFR